MRKVKPTTTDRPGKIGVNYMNKETKQNGDSMTYSTFRREFEEVKS